MERELCTKKSLSRRKAAAGFDSFFVEVMVCFPYESEKDKKDK